ncbi:unnamed protein product [Calypogeia fissa]
MVAGALDLASGVVLSSQSMPGSQSSRCCCFTVTCSSYLGPREHAGSGSAGSAGFSGRVCMPPLKFQLSGGPRTRHVRCVSTSPAADPDSMRIYYASGVPIEAEEREYGEQYLREELPPDLQPELMPKHVAIIMDGNARWAKCRGMHRSFGHAAGAEALKQVAIIASEWGISALTVFAFSTENWSRPQVEVDFLMHMFETKLQTEIAAIMRYNIRLRFVGHISTLPLSVQRAVETATECTKRNTGMIVNICVNYSGRADLVQACQQLALQVAEGSISPSDIDDAAVAGKVFMSELGELQDPDLVIRTSGEQRISNFLLWQVAYSEFVFSDTLWPDFGKEDLRSALVNYQQRDRRYGMRAA